MGSFIVLLKFITNLNKQNWLLVVVVVFVSSCCGCYSCYYSLFSIKYLLNSIDFRLGFLFPFCVEKYAYICHCVCNNQVEDLLMLVLGSGFFLYIFKKFFYHLFFFIITELKRRGHEGGINLGVGTVFLIGFFCIYCSITILQ